MYEPGRRNSAAFGPVRGHGQDDTPFTHRGFGDADVVLDLPVPGRPALLQVESAPGRHVRLWRIDRPGGPAEECVYDGPREGSDGSILISDQGLRTVRVRCSGAWSLQLKEPDAAREFERSVEGFGSEVVCYTGPLGVARLTGDRSGGQVEVRMVPPREGADTGGWRGIDERREQVWQAPEFEVAGPRLLVVTAGGAWSLDVDPTPPIRPDLPEGTFVLHGVGDLAAIVPITHPSEVSVLEAVWVSGGEFTLVCGEPRIAGAPLHRLGPDRPCLRIRPGVRVRGGMPIQIFGRGSEWEIRTTTPTDTPSGTGLGVADYDAADVAGFRVLPTPVTYGPDERSWKLGVATVRWRQAVYLPEREADPEPDPESQHAGKAADTSNPPRPRRSWPGRLLDRLRLRPPSGD
ncbi:hypothetical protein ACIBSV_04520 [Embleya sp. NPDC050154]|uniref:hypothetical protein n=1 Tax=Embleya sp. NPDC050154 TaxID=3363988 RepID=UPI0037A37F6B